RRMRATRKDHRRKTQRLARSRDRPPPAQSHQRHQRSRSKISRSPSRRRAVRFAEKKSPPQNQSDRTRLRHQRPAIRRSLRLPAFIKHGCSSRGNETLISLFRTALNKKSQSLVTSTTTAILILVIVRCSNF